MNWKKLQEYRCPMDNCNGTLKEEKELPYSPIHRCELCLYKITDKRLNDLIVRRDRHLEPPNFIKEEIERQKELNDL